MTDAEVALDLIEVIPAVFNLARNAPGRVCEMEIREGWGLSVWMGPGLRLVRLESRRAEMLTDPEYLAILEALPIQVETGPPFLLPCEDDPTLICERWTWMIFPCDRCGFLRAVDHYYELLPCKACGNPFKEPVVIQAYA